VVRGKEVIGKKAIAASAKKRTSLKKLAANKARVRDLVVVSKALISMITRRLRLMSRNSFGLLSRKCVQDLRMGSGTIEAIQKGSGWGHKVLGSAWYLLEIKSLRVCFMVTSKMYLNKRNHEETLVVDVPRSGPVRSVSSCRALCQGKFSVNPSGQQIVASTN
jgi:hypothetical protein